MAKINQRLNGLNPLSYIGVDAFQPTDFLTRSRNPTTSDYSNFYLGTWWLNSANNNLFYLAALNNGVATWISVSSMAGSTLTITGNSGGAVSPDGGGNINVIGDGLTVTIAGNPGTNTLTVSASGANLIGSLTGDSGGPVFSTAGNTNIIGSGSITVVGNPGTSTLTITPGASIPTSFNTQSGTATPAAGVLTINGANGLSTSGAGSTVTITGAGTLAQSFITSPATGTAVPAAGVLTFAGAGGTTVSAAGSTITITESGSVSDTFATQSGTATPAAGILTINGANGLTTSGAGSTVTITGASSLAQSFITSPATGTATPSGGVLTFAGTGIATVSAAGSTITISASGSGVVPSYSTGTFVPSLTFGGGSTGMVYSLRTGAYTQIGNLVYITVSITLTNKGSSTGSAAISGLPFTVSNSYGSAFIDSGVMNIFGGVPVSAGTTLYYIFGNFVASGTSMNLFRAGAGATATQCNQGSFNNDASFCISGSYFM